MSAAVPPRYKQTEVGVIPEDWVVKAISKVAPLQRGFDLPNSQLVKGQHPVVYSNGVMNYHNHSMASGPGVITGRSGTLGKIHYVESDYWPHNTSLWVTNFLGNIPKFVYYLYNSVNFERFASGSGVPTLNRNDAHAFTVALPSCVKEQQHIAEALSDADALIEGLESLIAKKRQLKQGAMRKLLTPKEGWEHKKLGDLANIQRGASPRPIDSPIWFDNASAVGWVRISDVSKSSMYLRETSQKLSVLGIQRSRTVSRGNLIMSIAATVGRPVITEIDVCIHDGFVVFNELRANKYFMYYFLKSVENDWSKHGQTGSQMNLNTGLINRAEVALPSIPEQTTIALILSDMDAEIAALEGKLAKARRVKEGMMQDLLTGRVRLV